MEKASRELFGDDVDIDIWEVIENGISEIGIRSEAEMTRYIEFESWENLPITEQSALRLIQYLDISPHFVDILTAFGDKDQAVDEIFSAYRYSTFVDEPHIPAKQTDTGGYGSPKIDSFFGECCYLLKYVELHDRPTEKDRPWAIRQVGVYQRYDFTTKRSICVLVRPPQRLMKLASETLDPWSSNVELKEEFCMDWTQIHILCLSAIKDQWRDHINSLDDKVVAMAAKLCFTKFNNKGVPFQNHQQSVVFSNLQDLEEVNEELLRLKHVLGLNISALETMKAHLNHMESQKESSTASGSPKLFHNVIDATTTELRFHKKSVKSVYERSARVLSMVRQNYIRLSLLFN
ncbi:hypothetical protein ABW20_dc0107160 [Dactylellina cionopaga]|nr:hypothetical protein ABW20_dc0107160 [Dactylellina cionopaga]